MSGLQPIGIDRGFRRYWLFSSINGLFIEDNDSDLNELLQPKVNNEVSDIYNSCTRDYSMCDSTCDSMCASMCAFIFRSPFFMFQLTWDLFL